eukprot:UN01674
MGERVGTGRINYGRICVSNITVFLMVNLSK